MLDMGKPARIMVKNLCPRSGMRRIVLQVPGDAPGQKSTEITYLIANG